MHGPMAQLTPVKRKLRVAGECFRSGVSHGFLAVSDTSVYTPVGSTFNMGLPIGVL